VAELPTDLLFASRGNKMALGLHSGTVTLHRTHDEWARAYDREAQRITAAIGPHILDICHVGSTAIDGVPAKPILDILVGVGSYEEATICIAPSRSSATCTVARPGSRGDTIS